MFVKTMSGQLIPVNHIEKVWKEKGPNNTIDGFAATSLGTVRLFYGEFERLWAGNVSFIPAHPGWKTLERFEDEEGPELFQNEVLSWAIYDDGHVLPVTIEGVDCGESQWEAYLRPDGKIVDKSGLNEFELNDYFKDEG